MLKITFDDFVDEQRWFLQGRLVGKWATELRSTWRARRNQDDARTCVVHLIEVAFIDKQGEIILAEMMSQGAECVATDVYTKRLLKMLRRDLERSPAKNNEGAGAGNV